MIFDSDVMIWAFRGNLLALKAIDEADTRAISSVWSVRCAHIRDRLRDG